MLIDVTRLVARQLEGRLPTGVDRVCLEYVKRYRDGAHALIRFGGRWLCLGPQASQTIFSAVLAPQEVDASTIRRTVASCYLKPWRRAHGEILLNVGHSGLDQARYAEWVASNRLRGLYFLHDLIPIERPEFSRPGEADRHRQRISTMCAPRSTLIVNSEFTRANLARYLSVAGQTMPHCVVAPLAPARLPQASDIRPMARQYFVVLGTIEPRKNHLLLLNVWRELVLRLGDSAPALVIIGQRGWECEQVVDLLERCEALSGHVSELARCADAELSTWLAHAQALLFPSFDEGYGMPLVEALASGVPVIASDLPVFREIAGDVPDYISPIDGWGWFRAAIAYADSECPQRLAQLTRMRSFVAPGWPQHFDVVDAVLDDLRG